MISVCGWTIKSNLISISPCPRVNEKIDASSETWFNYKMAILPVELLYTKLDFSLSERKIREKLKK